MGKGSLEMSPAHQARQQRMEQAVRTLLLGLGEDVEREGLRDTPKRVAKALLDCTAGYQLTTDSTLGNALFHEPLVHHGQEGLVLVRDIDFASTSEENLLPFHGRCHVAYVPRNGLVLGLSKLARLTKQYAKRLQTQEKLGADIARSLEQHLDSHGVAVVLQARHLLNNTQPLERTTATTSGCFAGKESAPFAELLAMLDLEDLPAQHIQQLDAHYCSSSGRDAQQPSDLVRAPSTPDASEKDTDGDSDSAAVEASCDEMEAAVQQLIIELGEHPSRPGLQGTARRYVMSLLASTSGYQQQLPCSGKWSQRPAQACEVPGCCGCSSSGPSATESPSYPLSRTASGLQQHSAALPTSAQHSADVGLAPASSPCALRQQQQQLQGSQPPTISHMNTSTTCSSGCSSSSGVSCSQPSLSFIRLPFTSQCEHHMLPFYGTLLVASLPADAHVQQADGATPCSSSSASLPQSEVEQIVTAYTQRLQVQERITHQVADTVSDLCGASASGVMVVCDAAHMCMVARGVENHSGSTTTFAARGVFQQQPDLRKEVLRVFRQQQQEAVRAAAAAKRST